MENYNLPGSFSKTDLIRILFEYSSPQITSKYYKVLRNKIFTDKVLFEVQMTQEHYDSTSIFKPPHSELIINHFEITAQDFKKLTV